MNGGTVEVCDSRGACIGYGAYSPFSLIRVRMFTTDVSAKIDEAFIEARVAAAVGRRADFWVHCQTNAFRLINAEADGLPGVTADYYAGFAVVQFSTAGAEFWKDAVTAALMKFVPGCMGVWNRSDVSGRGHEGLRPEGGDWAERETGLLAGAEPPELVEIHEGAVRYLVDVRRGHKTGFYLDQRDARAAVAMLANGAEMLNCFSYTGGFGLAARAAGAMSVTHVDASGEALELAKKNTDLDHLCGTKCEFVEADVFTQLRKYRDEGRKFDLIVLDPPKFADGKSGVQRAKRGYKDINLLAMKLLRPNGILATFSCSGAMTGELFDEVCRNASADARRDFQILQRTRQGIDHPEGLNFPEGLYLKGLIMRALD